LSPLIKGLEPLGRNLAMLYQSRQDHDSGLKFGVCFGVGAVPYCDRICPPVVAPVSTGSNDGAQLTGVFAEHYQSRGVGFCLLKLSRELRAV
jgi:hypothetical protein